MFDVLQLQTKVYCIVMRNFFYHIIWLLKGVKVFALVGKSGTGKSFRAKLVAQKYGIELIVDDGLLISDNKIIAGKSAKKETAFLSAIKTAVFDNPDHLQEVTRALESVKFKRILLLGTSIRMVKKIAHRLGLPKISKILQIEDFASRDEIELAIKTRNIEGKHVIPVPAIEIKKRYAHIFYDSVKVLFKRGFGFHKKSKVFEKAVVRPEFGKHGRIEISEAAITQMVLHCADEFDHTISINKVEVKNNARGYTLKINIDIPFGTQLSGNLHRLQEYIVDNIHRYTGIIIEKIDIIVDELSAYKKNTDSFF